MYPGSTPGDIPIGRRSSWRRRGRPSPSVSWKPGPTGWPTCSGTVVFGVETTWPSSWRTTPGTSRPRRPPSGPGCTTRCVNSYLTADEVAYIVNDCQARILITSAAKRDGRAGGGAPVPRRRAVPDGRRGRGDDAPFQPYEEAVAPYPSDSCRRRAARAGPVVLVGDHRSAQGHPPSHARRAPGRPAGAAARSCKRLWRMREGMVYLSPAPLYHSAPQASVALSLRLGATVDHHGALRRRAVPPPGRASPGHPLPGRADHVQPHAQAARRGPDWRTTCRRWRRSSTPPRRARFRSRSR